MRSKSFIAGALGFFLMSAGQSALAQEDTLPVPDRETSTLPVPEWDSSILPPPDQNSTTLSTPDQNSGILWAPDRDSTVIPAPDWDGSILPVQDTLTFPVQKQEGPTASIPAIPSPTAPVDKKVPEAVEPGAARVSRPVDVQPAAGQEQDLAVPPVDSSGPSQESRIPRQGMFWGLSAGINLHNYNTNGTDHSGIDIKGGPAFDGALFFGMDFGLLIGQAEVLFTGDNAAITYPYPYPGEVDVTGISLMIPFILKVDFHLGPLVLQPLAGLYLNFGLGNLKESGMGADREDPYANPPLGLIFGGSLGTPLGRGIVFLDGRCAIDLGRTAAGNNPITIWKRSAFMINLGYQFFIGRRR